MKNKGTTMELKATETMPDNLPENLPDNGPDNGPENVPEGVQETIPGSETRPSDVVKTETPAIVAAKTITLQEGYNVIGKFGKYQVLFSAMSFISFISSMMYLFSLPLFSTFPKITGCPTSDSVCDSEEDVCNAGNITYSYTDKRYNFITEYDLVCDDLGVTIITMAHVIGSLGGVFFFGPLSDNIGRLHVITIGQTGIIVCVLLIALISNFKACVYLSAIAGFFTSASYTPTYTFAFESAHEEVAKYYGTFVNVSYGVGQIMLALIMWSGTSWRVMCYIIIGWAALFYLLRLMVVESPHFLYTKNRFIEAAISLDYMAKFNSKTMPHPFKLANSKTLETHAPSCKHLFKVLFSKAVIFKQILCMCMFFISSFGYFGISMNLQNYQGNLYVNACLFGIVEMLAHSTSGVLMKALGKKPLYAASCALAGLSLLVLGFADLHYALSTVFMVLAKFGVTSCFNYGYVIVSELFPAVISSTSLALCTVADLTGSIIGIFIGSNVQLFDVISGFLCISNIISILVLPLRTQQPASQTPNTLNTI